ncbi:hypothetical protein AVEN_230404-1, partial [Araneus ventricosus]
MQSPENISKEGRDTDLDLRKYYGGIRCLATDVKHCHPLKKAKRFRGLPRSLKRKYCKQVSRLPTWVFW